MDDCFALLNLECDPFRTCTRLGLRASGIQTTASRTDEVILVGRDPSSPICALCRDDVSPRHDVRLDPGREYPFLAGDRVTLATDPPLALTVALLYVPECPR